MKLLPLLWLLCSLLLVVADQDPPAASAPKASIAGNATVVKLEYNTLAAAGATGTPIAAGSPANNTQTNNQAPAKATKIEQQPKEAKKEPAAPENVGKNRKRTDTDNPKPAGNATVTATTPKPVGVESKASTPAAAAPAPAPAPAAPSPKPNASETKVAKTSNTTTNTAQPTAGLTIVSEGQSMKDVTKANNATSHMGNNSTVIATNTTATAKTTSKTTPKPTKPPVVYSMGTHTEWEEKQEPGKAGDKPPMPKPVSTLAEPVMPQVQELTGTLSDRGDTSYVVPIVTVLLTVPLAIGVFTIMYRRFRDMWSTRHYRRMDFLVDGMYND
ncbi:hypothetical protein KR038_011141 [Drosophila bunnanda]|nr:hypothetical protein KR038_011141 [Drosophila bunnanda]